VPEVGLQVQKRKVTQSKNVLHHSSSTFFEFSSSLFLDYGRLRNFSLLNIVHFCEAFGSKAGVFAESAKESTSR